MATIADDVDRECTRRLCVECIEEACKPCGDSIGEYRLSGPQVEPGAAYWNFCPTPCPVSVKELTTLTDDPTSPHYFPPFPTDIAVIQSEFSELVELERLRYDPYRLASTQPCRQRCPLSTFLQLRPAPLGAVVNWTRGDGYPTIFNGAELARYFENETPGLAHRQALNHLIRETNWSPPRQALVWAALDTAIHSALMAAWYYKWLGRPDTARRERPWEYAVGNGCRLNVLFDRPVNGAGYDSVDDLYSYATGNLERNGRRPDFFPPVPPYINSSPGTPRHPAYPSGHSTYSGAASEILSFFFPDYRAEFDRLADNIGMARLWAGVHWRTDHVAGNKLGRTVACIIIDKLKKSGIPLVPAQGKCDDVPPKVEEIKEKADAFASMCGQAWDMPVPQSRCRVVDPCNLAATQPVSAVQGGSIDAAAAPPTEGQSTAG
ncbi:MAG TPA: vanadium-dependent haloperoxidase [Longimicrobium sp.]|nr:vanadium-dependent haloperoxidase [Longimicrobium sp.]